MIDNNCVNFNFYNLKPGKYYQACFNAEGNPAINDFIKIIIKNNETKQIEVQLK